MSVVQAPSPFQATVAVVRLNATTSARCVGVVAVSSSCPTITQAVFVPESESPAVIVIFAESIVAPFGIVTFLNIQPQDQIQVPPPSRPMSSVASELLNELAL